MGIDDDEFIKITELFRADSKICGIKEYSLVTDDSGDDFGISPNLRSRFRFDPLANELKLANINSQSWKDREASVYIKAVTTGDVSAYKKV